MLARRQRYAEMRFRERAEVDKLGLLRLHLHLVNQFAIHEEAEIYGRRVIRPRAWHAHHHIVIGIEIHLVGGLGGAGIHL